MAFPSFLSPMALNAATAAADHAVHRALQDTVCVVVGEGGMRRTTGHTEEAGLCHLGEVVN